MCKYGLNKSVLILCIHSQPRQSKSEQKELLMCWEWVNNVKLTFNPTGKASLNVKASYWQMHFNQTQWIIHMVIVELPCGKSIFTSFSFISYWSESTASTFEEGYKLGWYWVRCTWGMTKLMIYTEKAVTNNLTAQRTEANESRQDKRRETWRHRGERSCVGSDLVCLSVTV